MIILIILMFSLTPVSGQSGYEVDGHISGLGTTTILVLHLAGEDLPDLDTVYVDNDHFQFAGRVDNPYFVQLLVSRDGKTRKLTEFMLENACIMVTGSSPEYDHVLLNDPGVNPPGHI